MHRGLYTNTIPSHRFEGAEVDFTARLTLSSEYLDESGWDTRQSRNFVPKGCLVSLFQLTRATNF
jgi:hypothetical protein